MLILGLTSKTINPEVILSSSLSMLYPPAFEALSSSAMFPKRDEDGSSVEILIGFIDVS